MKKERIQKKYVYRWWCSLILTCLSSLMFFRVWVSFIMVNNQTGHLNGLGNLGMALLIYAGLYLFVGNGLAAFQIGVTRKMNVMASQILTLASVDILEIFVSMAITGQFRFFDEFLGLYFLMFLRQGIVLAFLTLVMVNIYRKTFAPIRILEIHGEKRNDLFLKLNAIPYKYHIGDDFCYTNLSLDLEERIRKCDAVLINDIPAHDENKILKLCFDMDKRVYFTPKISDIIVKSSDELNLVDTPLFLCRNIGISFFQSIAKRILDVLGSLLGLLILSPLLIVTAIAVKAHDKGPVFFRQERVTLDGKKFMIIKFRSMVVNAESDGKPRPAGEDDPRITPVGKVIRKYRIDELPQLLNILKGDMSIVGPRPERVEHVEKYTKEIPEFTYRNKVKGGLTGYAQVYGKYNTSALDKLKLDLYYICNYSILLDIQIIFETVKLLLVPTSATEGFSEKQQKEMHDK